MNWMKLKFKVFPGGHMKPWTKGPVCICVCRDSSIDFIQNWSKQLFAKFYF